MAKRQANGGRPSKGDRELFVTRVPKPVALVIRERAEELDLSYSEYLAGLLATALEMPQHAPSAPKDRDQEELPLTRAS
jgi:hypothetical protein